MSGIFFTGLMTGIAVYALQRALIGRDAD